MYKSKVMPINISFNYHMLLHRLAHSMFNISSV